MVSLISHTLLVPLLNYSISDKHISYDSILSVSGNPNEINGLSRTVCLVDNAAHILQHHEQQQLRLVDHLTPPEVLSKF